MISLSLVLSATMTSGAVPPEATASIAATEAALTSGRTTSEALVRKYLARIAALDRAGPKLHAVISINPDALAQARAIDAGRRAGRPTGALNGVPILVKDNIETSDPVPTTAGSLSLAANMTRRDAPVIARLRAAGAIILAKTNLSEWANMRSPHSTSGWSGVGGLTHNPYVLGRSPCGSSSGTGAGVAAELAVAGIGTETDGSITCPASVNGLVGLKPTVGLISRTYVVPISHSQDTPGPMGRSVADVAALLSVMAGSDPLDPATAEADAHRRDYSAALRPDALKGARIGVLRFAEGDEPGTKAIFERALVTLKTAGAILVDIKRAPPAADTLGVDELIVLIAELKHDLNAYLTKAAPEVKTRDLAALIAFNKDHSAAELKWFGQEFLEQALARPEHDDAYVKALEEAKRLAGKEGVDKLLTDNGVEALVAPTGGPAWRSDLIAGDHFVGGGAGNLPAVAGYPHLTVPMGTVHDLPVGLSFIGPKWSEELLLQLGFGYEQKTHWQRAPSYLIDPENSEENEQLK